MNILLTGGTGFIGGAFLSRTVGKLNYTLRAALRKTCPKNLMPPEIQQILVGDLAPTTDWFDAVKGCDVVVHCAARAHILHDRAADPLAEFRKINSSGTINLASQSLAAGVKRFIFLSSIGVNGNETIIPFTENDQPNPTEPYAISKLQAENGLWQLSAHSRMEIVIIRPPLVYGPNAPGNFGRLLRWVRRGLPLPLGAIHNKRSFVALDNLVDLIVTCLEHPAAANQTFLAGDGEDLSTTTLLQRVALAFGKSSRLIPVPMRVLHLIGVLLGKKTMIKSLCGSLQVDISKARRELGWTPPISVEEGLRRTVEGNNQLGGKSF
ncbi:MAG: SDR family oxidoreductase [Pseudomonadota bacterium]